VPANHPNQFGRLAALVKATSRKKGPGLRCQPSPAAAVALLEEQKLHHPLRAQLQRPIPAIERLIDQNTPVALKDQGQRRA